MLDKRTLVHDDLCEKTQGAEIERNHLTFIYKNPPF